jgi:hypothetical protein
VIVAYALRPHDNPFFASRRSGTSSYSFGQTKVSTVIRSMVFEAAVSFIVDEATEQPISLRINNERAAFEGRLVLGSVTLTPQENRHPEILHELQTALDQ